MPETNRFVERRDRTAIKGMATAVRSVFELRGRVNMLALLELALPDVLPGYRFEVVPDEYMIGAEGLTDLREPIIRLPEKVYRALEAGDTRARWTAAHELGHLLMHSNSRVHYARADHQDRCQDPEWQADTFAAEFLMPEKEFRATRTVEEAQGRFGVGYLAVKRRGNHLRHHFRFKSEAQKIRGAACAAPLR